MHAFQHQHSPLTLSQGIDEYYAAHPALAQCAELPARARQFFRCHDVAHVVFGCGTALDDEAVVKIASVLGTTAGLRVLSGYRLPESLQVYGQLRMADILRSIAHSVVIVPRTALRCLRQRARWPWEDHAAYLGMPLSALRTQFGITVAHRDAGVAGAAGTAG